MSTQKQHTLMQSTNGSNVLAQGSQMHPTISLTDEELIEDLQSELNQICQSINT